MSFQENIAELISDPQAKSSLSGEAYEAFRDIRRRARTISPYAISKPAAEILNTQGVHTDYMSTMLHTHGADKALENHMLSIVGENVKKFPTITLVQLKPTKLHFMKRGPHNRDKFVNYVTESKDMQRFDDADSPITPAIDTPAAFCSDTVHFMTTRQVWQMFESNPTLQVLYATLVLPIEAKHHLPSIYPEVYTLEYHKDFFAYYPGGHAGSGYFHPYNTLNWLSVGAIGPHITVDKLESRCAHHLFTFRRTTFQLQPPLAFGYEHSTFVTLNPIFYPDTLNVRKPYKKEFIMRCIMYVLAVKAVSMRDIFAKLRMVIESSQLGLYDPADLLRLANFLLFVASMQSMADGTPMVMAGMIRRFTSNMRERLRSFLAKFVGESSHRAMLQLLELQPLHFVTIPTRVQPHGRNWDGQRLYDDDAPLPDQSKTDPSELIRFEESALNDLSDEPITLAGHVQSLNHCPNDAPPPPPPSGHHHRTIEALSQKCSTAWSSWDNTPQQLAPQASGTVATEVSHPAPPTSLAPAPSNPALFETFPLESYHGAEAPLAPHDPEPTSRADELPLLQPAAETISGPFVAPGASELSSSSQQAVPTPTAAWADDEGDSTEEIEACYRPITPPELPSCAPKADLAVWPAILNPDVTSPGAARYLNSLAARDTHHGSVVTVLQAHGFKNHSVQYSDAGPIPPVLFRQPAASLSKLTPQPNSSAAVLAAHLHRWHRCFYDYTIDVLSASAIASDIKANTFGVRLRQLPEDRKKSFAGLAEHGRRTVSLCVVHGAGGAGKSRAIQEALKEINSKHGPSCATDLMTVLPTVNLLTKWMADMQGIIPAGRFTTFEKACERESPNVVVFDDYTKLPHGFIDFYLAIQRGVEFVILTGDPRQSRYHATDSDTRAAHVSANVARFHPFTDYYVNATHRQPRRLANPLGVHAELHAGGSVRVSTLIPKGATVLVPSRREQLTLQDLGHEAATYAGSQGLTIPHTVIAVDRDTLRCTPEVLYTALSRPSISLTLVNTFSGDQAFLDKLNAMPYLKTIVSGVKEQGPLLPATASEPFVREPHVKTHLPVENYDHLMDNAIENCLDKDVRELRSKRSGQTNLMQTENPVVQMFPHQQARDEALMDLTIQARIKKASPRDNARELVATRRAGNLLFEAYAQFMHVPSEPTKFNQELWNACRLKAEKTYVGKTLQQLRNGATRQDPDFNDNNIALFNKSQWVKKLEKFGAPFKAGQTISAFKQSVVLLTTTMALYLRAIRQSHAPKNVFIMCEKTPADFDAFVLDGWNFDRANYTSDYTQYDQSQDGAFLNFELRKALHLGVPEEVVHFYRWIKCNAKTFVGNLKIMRLSGEGPTFDANTECNIAYDALRFDLTAKPLKACYAGDDLVRDHCAPQRRSWSALDSLFELKAKPVVTSKPDFCGWRLSKYGICKNPVQLQQSLQLGLALGKVGDILPSYKLDFLYAYRMQDKLFEIFTEEEMTQHSATVRELVKRGVVTPVGEHIHIQQWVSDRIFGNSHKARNPDQFSTTETLELARSSLIPGLDQLHHLVYGTPAPNVDKLEMSEVQIENAVHIAATSGRMLPPLPQRMA